MVLDHDIARTLAILREMAAGKQLTLKSGYVVAMGIDMSIGFVLTDQDGNQTVGGLSEMTLSEFHKLLEREGVGSPLPSLTVGALEGRN